MFRTEVFMEELLLLGAGVVAVAIAAPVVSSLVNPEIGQAIEENGRNLLKEVIKCGLETTEKVQDSIATTEKSWSDLVAEAKTERENSRNSRTVHSIEISN
jgi:hypothetical protein